jgi:hypothetical protein
MLAGQPADGFASAVEDRNFPVEVYEGDHLKLPADAKLLVIVAQQGYLARSHLSIERDQEFAGGYDLAVTDILDVEMAIVDHKWEPGLPKLRTEYIGQERSLIGGRKVPALVGTEKSVRLIKLDIPFHYAASAIPKRNDRDAQFFLSILLSSVKNLESVTRSFHCITTDSSRLCDSTHTRTNARMV